MKIVKIAVVVVGLLVAAAAGLAVYGVPAGGAIERASRDALARQGLALTIDGGARASFFPGSTLTLDRVTLRDATTSAEIATVERVAAGIALADLWNARLRISDLTLTKPVLRADALGKRPARKAEAPATDAPASQGGSGASLLPAGAALAVDTITIENGTVVTTSEGKTREIPIEEVRVARATTPEGGAALQLDARSGTTTLRLVGPADAPTRLLDGMPVPIKATVTAADMFQRPVQIKGTLARKGPVIEIADLDGTIDQGRLRGKISVSMATATPFVDATLESERLDLSTLIERTPGRSDAPSGAGPAAGGSPPPTGASAEPWSDAPIAALTRKLPEGNIVFTARELVLGGLRVAPVALEATSLQETVTLKLTRAGLHGGEANGEAAIDRSRPDPALVARGRFSGLNTLEAMTAAANFQHLEGRARGAFDLTSTGASPKRIVANLNGRGDVTVENGAIRGVDLPRMVDSLLEMVLSGWQANPSDQTRFTKFGGTFTIANGVARTDDVALTGPRLVMSAAGSADLRNRTLAFRADPRILSAAGQPNQQATPGEPSGIGVPVMIQGPWSSPRIYADAPGILANPEGALKALRDQLRGDAPVGKLIEGLGKNLQQPGQGGRDPATLADDILRALKGDQPGRAAPSPAPQPQTSAPPNAAAPAQRQPPSASRDDARARAEREKAVRELEQGARDLLRDFLGGGGTPR